MKRTAFFLVLLAAAALQSTALGQVYTFPTDSLGRGYINRPYERYEAEPGCCTTTGTLLSPSEDQRTVQAEASHQQAAELSAAGQYVSWTVNRPGDGLTVRFSLPDGNGGQGTTAQLGILAGTDTVGKMDLSSWWAWQYCTDNYPGNTPKSNCVIRMKFDEKHMRLSRPVAQGETLTLVLLSAESLPCTIDFAELEPVPAPITFDDITDADKLMYDGKGDIADWIAQNEGKALYVPEGRYETQKRIYLRSSNGTRLYGAGMWYTEIYYAASSENINTYDKRGIEASKDNLVVDGFYFNTVNRQRYYQQQDSKQVGKAFMGSWGSNSVIRNCWAEHFECGAWIADYSGNNSKNLLVEHCRFRNNYADGINCCKASTNHTVRYCSFRNNGDDDIASWSTGNTCSGIEFAYCTAENNWRASSLAFFGGKDNRAHHIAIFDGLECGARVNADFTGTGFRGTTTLEDISIFHCGCQGGSKGQKGDFWGNAQGALNIGGTQNYSVTDVHLKNISVSDSRGNAFFIKAGNGKNLEGLRMEDITIDGAEGYGIYYSGATGNVYYCNIRVSNCSKGDETAHMPAYVITECGTGLEEEALKPITINADSLIYDITGRLIAIGHKPAENGVFIVKNGSRTEKIFIQ